MAEPFTCERVTHMTMTAPSVTALHMTGGRLTLPPKPPKADRVARSRSALAAAAQEARAEAAAFDEFERATFPDLNR